MKGRPKLFIYSAGVLPLVLLAHFLAGCAKLSLTREGHVKMSVPFDFPQKQDAEAK